MTPDRQQDPFGALLLFGPCSFGTERRATHTHTHTHTHTRPLLGAAHLLRGGAVASQGDTVVVLLYGPLSLSWHCPSRAEQS
jgi:hypothetical protein